MSSHKTEISNNTFERIALGMLRDLKQVIYKNHNASVLIALKAHAQVQNKDDE